MASADEMRNDETVNKIAEAKAAHLAAQEVCAVTMRAMDAAKFSKQIADEILIYAEWEAEDERILSSLRVKVAESSLQASKAEEVYKAAVSASESKYRQLLELLANP